MRSFSFDYESMMHVIFSSDSIYFLSLIPFLFISGTSSKSPIVEVLSLGPQQTFYRQTFCWSTESGIIHHFRNAFLEQYLGHQKNLGFSAELEITKIEWVEESYEDEFNLDVGDCRDTPTLFVLYITCVFLSSSLTFFPFRHTLLRFGFFGGAYGLVLLADNC